MKKGIFDNISTKNVIKWGIISVVIVIFFVIYKVFNPGNYDIFPQCPFYVITGYKCPGCGSQRAIHYLFNFEFANATNENFLLVASLPYIIVGAWLDTIRVKNEKQLKIRKLLFGKKAIFVVLVLIISFWGARNIFTL